MTLKKGQLISICPGCRRVVNFSTIGFTSKPIEDDIIEIGIQCPHCEHWQHSYYLNDELAQRGQEVQAKPRKIRRQYKKDFQKFQKKMKARYGLSSKAHQAKKNEAG